MGKAFTVLVIVIIGVVAFALIGPSLPEGNPLRGAAEGMRAVGRNIADGFGGGYGPTG